MQKCTFNIIIFSCRWSTSILTVKMVNKEDTLRNNLQHKINKLLPACFTTARHSIFSSPEHKGSFLCTYISEQLIEHNYRTFETNWQDLMKLHRMLPCMIESIHYWPSHIDFWTHILFSRMKAVFLFNCPRWAIQGHNNPLVISMVHLKDL